MPRLEAEDGLRNACARETVPERGERGEHGEGDGVTEIGKGREMGRKRQTGIQSWGWGGGRDTETTTSRKSAATKQEERQF